MKNNRSRTMIFGTSLYSFPILILLSFLAFVYFLTDVDRNFCLKAGYIYSFAMIFVVGIFVSFGMVLIVELLSSRFFSCPKVIKSIVTGITWGAVSILGLDLVEYSRKIIAFRNFPEGSVGPYPYAPTPVFNLCMSGWQYVLLFCIVFGVINYFLIVWYRGRCGIGPEEKI